MRKGTRLFAIGIYVVVIQHLISFCVRKPEFVSEQPSPFSIEIQRMDSLYAMPDVVQYGKAKTLIRMAASVTNDENNLEATGQLVRKLVSILDNPSQQALMNNPVLWFEAALEWETAMKDVLSINEDAYPPLLVSSGEDDFWESSVTLPWTSAWEHLLLGLVWLEGEKSDLALYEFSLMNPEDFGNNEYSVLACWISAFKMIELGFPAHSEIFFNQADLLLNDYSFTSTGTMDVSWMGTAREDVKSTLLGLNEILRISALNSMNNSFVSEIQGRKVTEILLSINKNRISEFHIIADLLLNGHQKELLVFKDNKLLGKWLPTEKGQNSKASRALFGIYISTWIWENFFDKKVLNNQKNLPAKIFQLMNTLKTLNNNLTGKV
jgi:hypothetical protein